VFVNAGFYIFVQLPRNTWIKIIVIMILASTYKISEKMANLRKHTEKKNDRKGL
jgi:hypothetical protein